MWTELDRNRIAEKMAKAEHLYIQGSKYRQAWRTVAAGRRASMVALARRHLDRVLILQDNESADVV